MRNRVKDVAISRGFKNAKELSLETGIPLASMYRIWNGKAKMIAFETLNSLCRALDANTGMLIEYIPDDLQSLRQARRK